MVVTRDFSLSGNMKGKIARHAKCLRFVLSLLVSTAAHGFLGPLACKQGSISAWKGDAFSLCRSLSWLDCCVTLTLLTIHICMCVCVCDTLKEREREREGERETHIHVYVCVHMCVHVCVCVYLCAYVCVYYAGNTRTDRRWRSGILTYQYMALDGFNNKPSQISTYPTPSLPLHFDSFDVVEAEVRSQLGHLTKILVLKIVAEAGGRVSGK